MKVGGWRGGGGGAAGESVANQNQKEQTRSHCPPTDPLPPLHLPTFSPLGTQPVGSREICRFEKRVTVRRKRVKN